jgi:predicted kinase
MPRTTQLRFRPRSAAAAGVALRGSRHRLGATEEKGTSMIFVAPRSMIVPVAPAARGKSTLAAGIRATVLSSDALRGQWCPTSPCQCTEAPEPGCPGGESCGCQNDRVFAEIRARALEVLRTGGTVLIDATNLGSDDRKTYVDIARTAGTAAVALLAAPLPLDELLRRNRSRARQVPEDVVAEMAEQHATITPEALIAEGFTRVEVWDDGSRVEVASAGVSAS